MNAMDKKDNDYLTPERFGEMYVTCRLDEGLFSDEFGPVIYQAGDAEARELSANELAAEIGAIMMPYLSTHPDFGFESFSKTVRMMAKMEKVYCHHSELTEEQPYIMISDVVDTVCESFGSQHPDNMMIYVKLGSSQKLYLFQYHMLKEYMLQHHKVGDVDIHMVTSNSPADETAAQGEMYVWLA